MLTETHIREALKVCFDPEIGVNVVDLGLVYAIEVLPDEDAPGIDPRYIVRVVMTMRSPSDEREALLRAQVENRLMGMREVSRAIVEIVWEPGWSAERMSDAARRQLGLDRPPKQGLVTIQPRG